MYIFRYNAIDIVWLWKTSRFIQYKLKNNLVIFINIKLLITSDIIDAIFYAKFQLSETKNWITLLQLIFYFMLNFVTLIY